jgi:hypothetical protein
MHSVTSSAGAGHGAKEAGLILRLVEVGRIWLGLGWVPVDKGRRLVTQEEANTYSRGRGNLETLPILRVGTCPSGLEYSN